MARGSIIKRGNNYAIKYRDITGRQIWRTIGPTKRIAERALVEALRDINQGNYREPQRIGFSSFTEKWLEDYAELKLKPTTVREYRGSINKYLIPYFKDIPLVGITPQLCQSLVTHLVNKTNLSNKTIANILVPLKRMFRHAVRWGFLRQNPAADIEKPRIEKKEMDYYTPTEARALLDALDEPYKTLFLTALETGLRQGELFGLTRPCVDLTRPAIQVRWQLNRDRKLVRPKTKAALRAVPIGPRLASALEKHLESIPDSELNLVFCTGKGTPYLQSNIDRRVFAPATKKAGIKKIRFHDLRHTYACWLASRGENIKYIQKVMGHSSITTSLDRYGHLLPDTGAGIAERHEAQLFGRIGSNLVAPEGLATT